MIVHVPPVHRHVVRSYQGLYMHMQAGSLAAAAAAASAAMPCI
jgi:hypothetical protein